MACAASWSGGPLAASTHQIGQPSPARRCAASRYSADSVWEEPGIASNRLCPPRRARRAAITVGLA